MIMKGRFKLRRWFAALLALALTWAPRPAALAAEKVIVNYGVETELTTMDA